MHYHMNPIDILDKWTMNDLMDAIEAIELQNHYMEQSNE